MKETFDQLLLAVGLKGQWENSLLASLPSRDTHGWYFGPPANVKVGYKCFCERNEP